MKIAILDPGYSHEHAHHQTFDLAVHRAFSQHQAKVLVVAAADLSVSAKRACLSQGVDIQPFFSVPCYPQHAEKLPSRQHEVLAQSFAAEVVALMRGSLARDVDHLFLHTGFSFHLHGLARALWDLKGRFAGRLLLSMMFHPGARPAAAAGEPPEILDFREFHRHREGLSLLQAAAARSGAAVTLAAPCRSYQRLYQSLWDAGEVLTHPSVSPVPAAEATRRLTARPRVLLFLGGPKRDKGFEFAVRLGVAAARTMPEVEFVFHYNVDFPGAAAFGSLAEELRQAGVEHGNISIIEGNLDDKEYRDWLCSCRVVCLLYDPVAYAFKTSGIFWDALRCPGMDWLVSDNTWAAAELTALGLPHATAQYGDVAAARDQLGWLLRRDSAPEAGVDREYLDLINGSFGEWVFRRFAGEDDGRRAASVTVVNADYRSKRGRILVVRTKFGHFNELSGPGGFIPHLRALGYVVDVIDVPLGSSRLEDLPQRTREAFAQAVGRHLSSYMGNAAPVETDLQRSLSRHDVIHFLDAEHCGLLSALRRLRSGRPGPARLVATYHQPRSILEKLIVDPGYLRGMDRIHILSPCQRAYFEPHIDEGAIRLTPHGLEPALFEKSLPALFDGPADSQELPGFEAALGSRRILLTVGAWLRDFQVLLDTARGLVGHKDLVFVVVSKGLKLDAGDAPNVLVCNKGVGNARLHKLYRRATLLFLPLKDGAANNAILEAMAHGLPIVTTDLPSAHYYTDGQAVYAQPEARAYVTALEETLKRLEEPGRRAEISEGLRTRARELVWRNVACLMHRELYSPLLEAPA